MQGQGFNLEIIDRRESEIVHFYDAAEKTIIESTANKFTVSRGDDRVTVTVPCGSMLKDLSLYNRYTRRLLRTDMSNALFSLDRLALIIVYQGRIFRFDFNTDILTNVGQLIQCRNVLHRGICVLPDGTLALGEYGNNGSRSEVPIWGSFDGGRSWDVVHRFPAGSIKHVHGVYHDTFTDQIYVPTGDFEGECFVYVFNRDFVQIDRLGDGTQRWRFVSCLFEKDRIIWGMDSPLVRSSLQIFDRSTKTLRAGMSFDAPVWYTKQLEDGVSLLQTSVEIGPSVKDSCIRLFASEDKERWHELLAIEKDAFHMKYFQFGVAAFADGPQSSESFAFHVNAGRHGFDGRVFIARLTR